MRKIPGAKRIAGLFSGHKSIRHPQLEVMYGNTGIQQLGHRRYVGGMWKEIGQLQFEFMIAKGLRPNHYLLDVACGSLRGGVHFIPYLEPEHYLGLEKEQALIDAGIKKELGLILFKSKKPQFIVSANFEFELFTAQPDFVLAQSLFTHLPPPHIKTCLTKLRASIAKDGVFFATFFEVDSERVNPSEPHDHACFAYTKQQMEEFGLRCGWNAAYIGDWNHPRGQAMFKYTPE